MNELNEKMDIWVKNIHLFDSIQDEDEEDGDEGYEDLEFEDAPNGGNDDDDDEF